MYGSTTGDTVESEYVRGGPPGFSGEMLQPNGDVCCL